MSSVPADFVVTHEHQRFAEFCDACRRYRYIGLCYGSPGVGKTPDVVNAPRRIAQDIDMQRHQLRMLAVEAWLQAQRVQSQVRKQEEARLPPKRMASPKRHNGNVVHIYEATTLPGADIAKTYAQQRATMPDPTDLIIIDEADRLKTASLEQVRDIFDQSELGLVLIGMPGLEKRLSRYPQLYSRVGFGLSRYPQLYSRVGFVHAFRPLRARDVRELLQGQWHPPGVVLPEEGVRDDAALAAIIRVTGGNFRLLHRLLTQIARLVEINALQTITSEVVEAARESLVIGTA